MNFASRIVDVGTLLPRPRLDNPPAGTAQSTNDDHSSHSPPFWLIISSTSTELQLLPIKAKWQTAGEAAVSAPAVTVATEAAVAAVEGDAVEPAEALLRMKKKNGSQ